MYPPHQLCLCAPPSVFFFGFVFVFVSVSSDYLLHCWCIFIICVCVPLQVSLSLSLSPSPLTTFKSLIYPPHNLCLRAPPSEVISAEKYGRWDERTEVAGKLNKQWLYYSFTLLQPLLFCCKSDQVNICNRFVITINNIFVLFMFMLWWK